MSVYDVYIATNGCEQPIIRQAKSWNPDDAIHALVVKGDFIPEHGDRVIRCVEVDRPDQYRPGRRGNIA